MPHGKRGKGYDKEHPTNKQMHNYLEAEDRTRAGKGGMDSKKKGMGKKSHNPGKMKEGY